MSLKGNTHAPHVRQRSSGGDAAYPDRSIGFFVNYELNLISRSPQLNAALAALF
jgi:hypothetical protein